MPKISVIIPVFCVEAFIERSARSLFDQTLDDIEYIFVDDCSPDNSMAVLQQILKEYPDRQESVRIINHRENQGVACSRIDGMKAATGKYIIHCDTDDWLDLDLYEKLFRLAESNDADIATCDFITEQRDGSPSHRITSIIKGTPRQMLSNMHNESFYCMLWRSMIRREMIEKYNLYPIPHVDLWEDVYVTLRAYYYANKVVKVDDSLYHYYVNPSSITANSTNPKHFQDMRTTITYLDDFFSDKKDFDSSLMLSFWKILAKSSLLTRAGFDPKRWRSEYKEANKSILSMKSIPFIRRVIYLITSISTVPVTLIIKISERR